MELQHWKTLKNSKITTKQETHHPFLLQNYQLIYISQQFQFDRFIIMQLMSWVLPIISLMKFIGDSSICILVIISPKYYKASLFNKNLIISNGNTMKNTWMLGRKGKLGFLLLMPQWGRWTTVAGCITDAEWLSPPSLRRIYS